MKLAITFILINTFYIIILYNTGFDNSNLIRLGAVGFNKELWRIFTGAFMHSSIEHFIGNMTMALIGIPLLQYKIGTRKTTLVCLVSLVISGLMITISSNYAVGFSGVLYGVLGAFVGLVILNKLTLKQSIVIMICLIYSIILNATQSNLSVSGHLGGFIGGILTIIVIEIKGVIKWQTNHE